MFCYFIKKQNVWFTIGFLGGGISLILVSILNVLQGKSLTIQDSKDVLFFSTAMEICRFHLTDKDLAFVLDQLLHTSDNYNLIGDSYKESVY